MWKCYNKECENFKLFYVGSMEVTNNCTTESSPCHKAILEQPQEPTLVKPFINLKEATVEELGVIILDRSFEYWFRADALKEYDSRF